jgi:glycopeptide antibiotics resistance protein
MTDGSRGQDKAVWVWRLLAAASVLWLLWMTQRPQADLVVDLAPLTEPAAGYGISSHILISIIGNVAVFVPLGLAVARSLALGRGVTSFAALAAGTAFGALVSVCIELLQMLSPSRFPDWRDLVLNTLGALVGAVLAVLIGYVRRRKGDEELS